MIIRPLLVLASLAFAALISGCGDRFEEVERRIESQLPKERGVAATPVAPPADPNQIHLILSLADLDDGDSLRVEIRQGVKTQALEGSGNDDEFWSRVARAIAARKASAIASAGGDTDLDVRGAIEVRPASETRTVSHAMVVLALDAFLRGGVLEVEFAGASPPLVPRPGR